MAAYPRLILHKGKERSLLNFHPWLFSGAIKSHSGDIVEGSIVDIYSGSGTYLATGHFHEGSIAVKIFSFKQIEADYSFWKQKLLAAYTKRVNLGLTTSKTTNAIRLVHGEGDFLPGLIIDFYAGVAVLQIHTTGMNQLKETLSKALQEILGESLLAIYNKSADTFGLKDTEPAPNEYLFKRPGFDTNDFWIKENDFFFRVDWEKGQKTGFFLDQRENRKLLQGYCAGKSVLNTFSYSGGFSVFAIAGGATLVHSVDSSKAAATWCEQNVSKNFPSAPHRFFTQDAFDFLKTTTERYDTIILDPPAFAKHLSSQRKACVGYQNLNAQALRQIKPGGILFTFSCSQVIDKKLFRQVVFAAAASTGREVTVLHQLSQPPDHPISIFHLEGEYLKGLVLRVD